MGTALVKPYEAISGLENYSSEAMVATQDEVGHTKRRSTGDTILTKMGNIPAAISKMADTVTHRQFKGITKKPLKALGFIAIGALSTLVTPIKTTLAALHTLFQGAKAFFYKVISLISDKDGRRAQKASEAFTRAKAGLVSMGRGYVQSIPVIGHMVMNGLDRIYDAIYRKFDTASRDIELTPVTSFETRS